ncbi:MAG: TetR/AcrR family transcriptional regulator [Lachnospiraceae bacterium]|nr:TetR/AcrR family transcriptional regulator [Lachnospiraceae bacterium]
MPPKCKFKKEEIVQAALEIARDAGIASVTARAVASKLNSSPKVIFGHFQSMDELQNELLKSAGDLYQNYIYEDIASKKYPPYKASGMAYIRFAKEEKELFKLLFMRDRSNETITENSEEIRPLLEILKKNLGLSEAEANMFHLEMWLFVHGIATMSATSYLDLDMDFISKTLTDEYMGLKHQYCREEKKDGSN